MESFLVGLGNWGLSARKRCIGSTIEMYANKVLWKYSGEGREIYLRLNSARKLAMDVCAIVITIEMPSA